LPWSAQAQELLRECVSSQPVLIQISVAKTLRDTTDRAAQQANETQVSAERLLLIAKTLGMAPGHQAQTSSGADSNKSQPTKLGRGVSA